MSSDSQQAITHVLQQDSKILGPLLHKINQLKQWNVILAQHIDPKLAQHCFIANYEENQLIIYTQHAVWATQCRFQIPVLTSILRKHPEFYALKHIQCKVMPLSQSRMSAKTQAARKPALLSTETAKVIVELSRNIKHDKLQQIMQRIALHTKK